MTRVKFLNDYQYVASSSETVTYPAGWRGIIDDKLAKGAEESGDVEILEAKQEKPKADKKPKSKGKGKSDK